MEAVVQLWISEVELQVFHSSLDNLSFLWHEMSHSMGTADKDCWCIDGATGLQLWHPESAVLCCLELKWAKFYCFRLNFYLTTGFWGKEAWRPPPNWNTRFFFAFSKRTQLWLPYWFEGNGKILWYYEKWVERHALFPRRQSVKMRRDLVQNQENYNSTVLTHAIIRLMRQTIQIPLHLHFHCMLLWY